MYIGIPSINTDAGGRSRVSEITTLFDGKCLGADNLNLWENVGTGASVFTDNISTLSVTAGQYRIRRGRQVTPYFSGKSHLIETTLDNFASQIGLVKRAGYFSSNIVAPYDSEKDGFWLQVDENDAISIEIQKTGVVTESVPFANWDNYQQLQNYDFDNFTVIVWDFLWLGGTEVRMWLKTENGFVLAHTYKHASTKQGLFIKSPNHSARYEIRSTTGIGSMNAICSSIGTEGSLKEEGEARELIDTDSRDTNVINTIYALKGVKKLSTFNDSSVVVLGATLTNNTISDFGVGLILLNPTLSAPLTYVNNDKVQDGTTSGVITVTNIGTVIGVISAANTGSVAGLNKNVLSKLGTNIDGSSDEIILAYKPTTSNQSMLGTLGVKVF